jgi:hypothetical protein
MPEILRAMEAGSSDLNLAAKALWVSAKLVTRRLACRGWSRPTRRVVPCFATPGKLIWIPGFAEVTSEGRVAE